MWRLKTIVINIRVIKIRVITAADNSGVADHLTCCPSSVAVPAVTEFLRKNKVVIFSAECKCFL